jgi:hypothetical protein
VPPNPQWKIWRDKLRKDPNALRQNRANAI